MKQVILLILVCFAIALHAGGENDNEINAWRSQMKDVISRVQDLETENDKVQFQVKDLKNENNELKHEIELLKTEKHELEHKMNDINDEVEYLRELSKLLSVRTCEEMHDYGINKSDYYLVDPDGPLNGEEPIRVYCDFTEDYGFTRISHDTEQKIEVAHCNDPGCYARPIVYDSSMEQIKTLIELSNSCSQPIRYDCFASSLQTEGVNYGYWIDKNGEDQIYWTGANYGNHVCNCHFSEEGCVEESTLSNTCNCDSKVPAELFDEGYIDNSTALPITELRFGGLDYDAQSGFHTLGKLSCGGKNNAMYGPIVFSAYKNSGSRAGAGSYLDDFDKFLTNQGNAFVLSNGIFTAQRTGTYEFSVSARDDFFREYSTISVEKNGVDELEFSNYENSDRHYSDDTLTFNWIIELKQKDIIRLKVTAGSFFFGSNSGCIFNGKYI